MDSHNHMKSDCIVCGKECLPLYTRGYGIDQVSFCSEECLKKQLEICMLSKNKFVLPEDVDNLRILVELKCKVVTIEYEKELAEALNASLNA